MRKLVAAPMTTASVKVKWLAPRLRAVSSAIGTTSTMAAALDMGWVIKAARR